MTRMLLVFYVWSRQTADGDNQSLKDDIFTTFIVYQIVQNVLRKKKNLKTRKGMLNKVEEKLSQPNVPIPSQERNIKQKKYIDVKPICICLLINEL